MTEFQIKMRRLRAEQEREFLEYINRTPTEKFIDFINGILESFRQWKCRWKMRFNNIQGEYIRRNKPDRVVYLGKYGETRKTWSQYLHMYTIHTFFGEYEFSEFEHKTTGEIKWDKKFPLYTKTN
jgi:hypothetical protein